MGIFSDLLLYGKVFGDNNAKGTLRLARAVYANLLNDFGLPA